MKVKHFLLTAIAILCCVAYSEAAISIQLENGHLVARTDQVGQAGYKGCSAETAEKVPAYIFELQVKNNAVNGTCPVGQGGHWKTIRQLRPETGSATFENIPDGSATRCQQKSLLLIQMELRIKPPMSILQ